MGFSAKPPQTHLFILLGFQPRGCTQDLFRSLRSRGIRCRGRHGQIHWHEVAALHSRLGAWGSNMPSSKVLVFYFADFTPWHDPHPF